MPQPQWEQATQAIQNAKSILVVGHFSPDGDAIGSTLGLATALRAMGKQVDAANDDGMPDYLDFIEGADTMKDDITGGKWDVMVSVDSSDEERTGKAGTLGRENSKTVVNLDHHATNTLFGDIHLVVPSAVSATEIVFDWLIHMGYAIDESVAVPLMVGLVTDTIGFRISSVTPRTLEIAQALMAAGANLPDIIACTLESRSYKKIELWKRALATVQLEGQVVSAVITRKDIEDVGLKEMTDGGLVGLLRQVNEAAVAVVLKEVDDERVEISLRSKVGYDVSAVAFSLGGGGHKQAAGATVDGALDAVRERIISLLQQVPYEGTPVVG